jgi:hypothetical protein
MLDRDVTTVEDADPGIRRNLYESFVRKTAFYRTSNVLWTARQKAWS